MAADRELQDIILETEDDEWVRCTGYRLLAHSMESFVAKLEEIKEESQESDGKIIKKLDTLVKVISKNKEDGNQRALQTTDRLARLETSVSSLSSTVKWMARTVFFGIGIFLLQQFGVIEWIVNLIKSLF